MRVFSQNFSELTKSFTKQNAESSSKKVPKTSVNNVLAGNNLNNIVSFEKFREPEKKALFSIHIFEENDIDDKAPKSKKDFDDVWTLYRDAENTAPTVHTEK